MADNPVVTTINLPKSDIELDINDARLSDEQIATLTETIIDCGTSNTVMS